jgi:hypothetical protein
MRKNWQLLVILAVLSLGITGIGKAQRIQLWPDNSWWHYSSNVLENHPTAHLLGGGLVNLLVRGPWITKSWRNTIPKRLLWCGVFQGAWESFQILEIKGYPFKYGAWDWEAAMVGCTATEGLLKLVGK